MMETTPMDENVIRLPQPASPTIDEVFEAFLAEQRERLKPKTLKTYSSVIDLLRDHLNGYGHDSLSETETVLLDRHYNAEGEGHREFCQVFGPDKIPEHLGMFLGYFMVRKVMAGADFKRSAGTVTKKLSKWLAAKGHVSAESAALAAEQGADAARDLPSAERAADLLLRAADPLSIALDDLADDDYMDFDHYTIARIEPGKLWFDVFGDDEPVIGPVAVPKKATDLLQAGWDISCALARIRGRWRIVEVANVYPL
jgi:hypothetical protein